MIACQIERKSRQILQRGRKLMHLSFVDTKEEILALNEKSKHVAPHLHNALEIVCELNGTLDWELDKSYNNMEKEILVLYFLILSIIIRFSLRE